MKNNLPYFSHDNDAYSHPKMRALRARFGWEGYGRFWALNELISDAEGCRLDLSRPLYLADSADKIGLSAAEMQDFIRFLADPELCGLIQYENGIITTDRTQEDLERVSRKRVEERERYLSKKGNSATRKPDSATRKDTEQIRADESREDKSSSSNGGLGISGQDRASPPPRGESAAAAAADPAPSGGEGSRPPPALTADQLVDHLAFHPALPVDLDPPAAERVLAALRAHQAEDLAFVGFLLQRIKAKGAAVKNPPGLFLELVESGEDHYAAWRRQVAARDPPPAPCPACGRPLRRVGEDWTCEACRVTWIREGETLVQAPAELDYFTAPVQAESEVPT